LSNPSKAAGTGFETDVKDYLNERDLGAERTGSADLGMGDVHFGPGLDWTLEAKAEQKIDLPGYLRQLADSVERRGTQGLKSAVVIKNRRHSTADAYAVMTLANYRRLVLYVSLMEIFMEAFTGFDLSKPEHFKSFILDNDTDGLFA
jgi:hypothetical protein